MADVTAVDHARVSMWCPVCGYETQWEYSVEDAADDLRAHAAAHEDWEVVLP